MQKTSTPRGVAVAVGFSWGNEDVLVSSTDFGLAPQALAPQALTQTFQEINILKA